MTECPLQVPHRYDPSVSVRANVLGQDERSTDQVMHSCPNGFVEGLGFSSIMLFAGALSFMLPSKRATRWSRILAAGALGYWVLLQFARLNVFLKPYGPGPEDRLQRQYWLEAAASQAAFELIVLVFAPAALIALAIGFSRKISAQLERDRASTT